MKLYNMRCGHGAGDLNIRGNMIRFLPHADEGGYESYNKHQVSLILHSENGTSLYMKILGALALIPVFILAVKKELSA